MGVTGAALGTRTLWRAVRRRTRFWLRAAAECVIRGTEGRRPRGTHYSTGLRHIRRPLNLSGLVAFAALGKPLGGNVDDSDGLACALLGIANL